MTDPNFVSYLAAHCSVQLTSALAASCESLSVGPSTKARQAGDHVHLGPGVTGTRLTDPAFPLEELPAIDVVVLSHFHAGGRSCVALCFSDFS